MIPPIPLIGRMDSSGGAGRLHDTVTAAGRSAASDASDGSYHAIGCDSTGITLPTWDYKITKVDNSLPWRLKG